jgi:hypothetical protein
MIASVLNDKTLRVAAYGVAAALALGAGLAPSTRDRRAGWLLPGFWTATCAILAALALSREIDLASRVASIGRDVFRTEGWYPDRRPVQEASVVAVLAVATCVFGGGAALLVLRKHPQLIPGFAAVLMLATFLAVRAISLHHIDSLLYRRSIGDVQINALAELAAIAAVALAALLAMSLSRVADRNTPNRAAGSIENTQAEGVVNPEALP